MFWHAKIPTWQVLALWLFANVGFAAMPFEKTPEQRAYLQSRGPITMCVDPDWMPYEKIDSNGRHIGIAADYMVMFQALIEKPIELVPTENWSQSELFAAERECDILSMLNYSEIRAEYLNFTDPYVEASVVIVARDDVPFIDGLNGLAGQTMAIVKDYVYEQIIRDTYPNIELVYVDTVDDGFIKVSEGKIDSTLASLFIVTSQISQLGLSNLKIAGAAEFKNQFRVGVRNDDEMLLGLFQQAVENIDVNEENVILRRWISVRLETGTDYVLLAQVLFVATIVVGLLLYRQWSIRRLVSQLNHANQQLQIKSDALSRLSRTDSLTKLHNRLYLDEHMVEEIQRFERYGAPFCCVMLDVDKFKDVNDLYGHATGDRVLQEVAIELKSSTRVNDILGRWGGEEFLIICPQTTLEGAVTLAETLRVKMESRVFSDVKKLTCSFGVSEVKVDETQERLLARADEALYRAKARGRNQVCTSTDHDF